MRHTIGLGMVLVFAFCADGAERIRSADHLEGNDPFHVHRDFPKLTTPQWVGEAGVEAVVILAIDDMREPAGYETFLRPILERLKRIDGRAPVSIYCNRIDPLDPQLQLWLEEGLSLEVHTMTHPCPLLADDDFGAASLTYHDNVDLLKSVAGNGAVAFRMPCCDSMNSASPRFYAELFNGTSAAGHYLTIDSSVMNFITSRDRTLPRSLVIDDDGRERFGKYRAAGGRGRSLASFVTTIEDYPYPYVIGGRCWEFPATVPSDWEAQNLHGVNNPATVSDMKAALDVTVIKQGVYTTIFHPHGWIQSGQMVEFIDYAVRRYGGRVRFLTLREADERLRANLLGGQGLRDERGGGAGVRVLDLDGDGYMDVVLGGGARPISRVWRPERGGWDENPFPVRLEDGVHALGDPGVKLGVVRGSGRVSLIVLREGRTGGWDFDGGGWVENGDLLRGLEPGGARWVGEAGGRDAGVRLVDLDFDGRLEMVVGNGTQNAVLGWEEAEKRWVGKPYSLPEGARTVDSEGNDAGLRFVDLDEDGFKDVIWSNPERYGVHLFIPQPRGNWDLRVGWTRKIREGKAGEAGAVPLIVRAGRQRNNGAWFHSGQMWVQNEETARLPDQVDRRSFRELITLPTPGPLSPVESMAAMRLVDGFEVEVVAAEPLVQDPVAFEWGADGRLWVVEMRDYPDGIDGKGKAGGVVRFLEDTTGDGRYDRSTVFLEGLNYPSGVMPWRGGVLVSAAPDILYAADSDGDGKADVRQVLFTGFKEGNQQHRVNGFELGLDNWVYLANGDSGGTIRRVGSVMGVEAEMGPVNISGHDLRIRPDEGLLERVEGQTQFGRRRDDWGNWFGNHNPAFLWHYWIPDRYLRRNPRVGVRSTRQMLANYEANTRVHAISKPIGRFNFPEMVDTLTSANSPTPYRDDLFGAAYRGSVFISEPANNLVHREVLEADGVSFRSRAGEEAREFLASTDVWFRPAMLKTGPDGALYIADMYRLVIEHTEYGLPDVGKFIEIRAGADRGRIYRVRPRGVALREVPALGGLDESGLARAMESPSGWQRDTVQRLLLERGGRGAVAVLRRLAGESGDARVRMQSLCALDGLGGLTSDLVMGALSDGDPGVREHAVRLSEAFIRDHGRGAGEMVDRLLGRVEDPAERVRYQLALTLGESGDPRVAEALVRLGLGGGEPLRVAVMTSAVPHVQGMLASGLRRGPGSELTRALLGLAVELGEQDALKRAIGEVVRKEGGGYQAWQFAAVSGLIAALESGGRSLEQFGREGGGRFEGEVRALGGVIAAARVVVVDRGREILERVAATELLGRGPVGVERDQELALLAGLLGVAEAELVQEAAVRTLGRVKDAGIAGLLVSTWRELSPGRRLDVLRLLLSRGEWTVALLDAVDQGRIGAGELGPAIQQQLARHGEAAIAERARKRFTTVAPDRQNVLGGYGDVARLEGDPVRGRVLFQMNCATCHRAGDVGVAVGPDLAAVTDRTVAGFVASILDPNRVVEPAFAGYDVTTRDGRELSGIVVAETGNSITLKSAGGSEEVILRRDLGEVRSSGVSMMPEGLEVALPPQAMADLLAFLGVGRWGKVEGD